MNYKKLGNYYTRENYENTEKKHICYPPALNLKNFMSWKSCEDVQEAQNAANLQLNSNGCCAQLAGGQWRCDEKSINYCQQHANSFACITPENKWQVINYLDTCLYDSASVKVSDKFYMAGGVGDQNSVDKNLRVYDLKKNKLTIISELPTGAATAGNLLYNPQDNNLFYLGSNIVNIGISPDIWSFNLNTNQWKNRGVLPPQLYVGSSCYVPPSTKPPSAPYICINTLTATIANNRIYIFKSVATDYTTNPPSWKLLPNFKSNKLSSKILSWKLLPRSPTPIKGRSSYVPINIIYDDSNKYIYFVGGLLLYKNMDPHAMPYNYIDIYDTNTDKFLKSISIKSTSKKLELPVIPMVAHDIKNSTIYVFGGNYNLHLSGLKINYETGYAEKGNITQILPQTTNLYPIKLSGIVAYYNNALYVFGGQGFVLNKNEKKNLMYNYNTILKLALN